MQILITDVTEMKDDTFCVAGWNADEKRMVRPLPGKKNWPGDLLRRHAVKPGAVIACNAMPQKPNSDLPHVTEDTWVYADSVRKVRQVKDWCVLDGLGRAETVSNAFADLLEDSGAFDGARKGVYVPSGAQTASLRSVDVERSGFHFVEDNYQGNIKLRAVLFDGDVRYRLAVASHEWQELWREDGVAGVNDALPAAGTLHVRLGLARAWDERPGQCALMINGVFW